jgi:uncharacterized protein (DUF302 family)
MYYIIESKKSFETAAADLETAVKNHGFGVLHVHDLGATLRSKGFEFQELVKIFEVCNPMQASRVLSSDMKLNMALPCRISVYTEKGKTKIGYLRPVDMLAALSTEPALRQIALEVEEKIQAMVTEAQ